MSLDKMRQAVSGEEYAGVFEVHVHRAGTLANFKILGEGWKLLSLETPKAPKLVQAGVVRIPFRAVPTNPDEPVGLSLTYNGRKVAKAAPVGPAYFARAGKPYGLVQVPGTSVPTADELKRGLRGASGDVEPDSDAAGIPLHFVGRIVYSRPCRDMSNPDTGQQPDGDCDDPWDIPASTIGVDRIDVRVLDNDDLGTEEIWSGYTDENGYFDTGVIDWDDPGDDPDLILYCETEIAGIVDVTDSSWEEWTYTFQTGEIEDFTGSYHDFGWYFPEPTSHHPALHIFNSVVRTHRFIQEKPAYVMPKVQVEWPDDSQGSDRAWYEYYTGLSEIHISTGRQWRNDTVSHEYGHHFIKKSYDPQPPDPDYCNEICDPDYPNDDCGHCTWCQETDHDAWNEGFPNWLADVVTRDYPNRYTHEPSGVPFVPLYTRSQEEPATCDGIYDDPILTEGYVGALLRDIEDQTQDDHDDDPDPAQVQFDGIFDLMCLGPVEIFRVTYLDQPITVTDFISAFLARYPEYTDLLWPTAFNVGGPAYVVGFPADTQAPGTVLSCNSPTHPVGTGGSLPCITFEWWPARDDVRGASRYSYTVTTDPNGLEPIAGSMVVTGTDTCTVSASVPVWELGEHYFSIKAGDSDGNWSSQWTTFGPFEIVDCNGSGILDACDISCIHDGSAALNCEIPISPCPGLPGCGLSNDCQPNLVPDECDIASGTSEDCNLNAVPDECEEIYHWDGTSGSWHSPDNWLEGEPPPTDFNVCIEASGDQTVTYSTGSSQIASLACRENLDIAGGSYPWANLTLNEASWIDGVLKLGGDFAELHVNDRLDINGLFDWTGSPFLYYGALLAGSGVTYANNGVQIVDIVGLGGHLVLEGNSTSTTTGRVHFLGTSSVFEIRPGSTYEHQGSGYVLDGSIGNVFDNGGRFIASIDTGAHWIDAFTENSGLIHVQDGTLALRRGNSSSGQFLGDPGTTLSFAGGQEFLPGSSIVADNVTFTGSTTIRGTYEVTTATTHTDHSLTFASEANIISCGSSFSVLFGTVNFDATVGGTIQLDTFSLGGTGYATANFNSGDPIQIRNLIIGPGTVQGPSTVTVSTLLTWGGESGQALFNGPGVVNVDGDMTIAGGSSTNVLNNRVLNNAGTATFLGAVKPSSSAVFNNLAGGVMDIQNDGDVFSIDVSSTFDNAGTLVKSAGVGTSTIAVHFHNSGIVEVQSGDLEFNRSYILTQQVQTAGETVLNGGDLAFTNGQPYNIQGGLLTGAGTITGNVVNAGGTTAPGLPLGLLNVIGAYTQQAGATLRIEIGGKSTGQFDRVACTGTATLAGTLEIVLISAFQPQPGDYFEVLSAGAVVGTFETVVGADLPGEDDFAVIYMPGAVILAICPLVPPDFDGDCDVDGDDYDLFESCASGPDVAHSGTTTCQTADFDADNDIDQDDFGTFQRCYSGENNLADPNCAD